MTERLMRTLSAEDLDVIETLRGSPELDDIRRKRFEAHCAERRQKLDEAARRQRGFVAERDRADAEAAKLSRELQTLESQLRALRFAQATAVIAARGAQMRFEGALEEVRESLYQSADSRIAEASWYLGEIANAVDGSYKAWIETHLTLAGRARRHATNTEEIYAVAQLIRAKIDELRELRKSAYGTELPQVLRKIVDEVLAAVTAPAVKDDIGDITRVKKPEFLEAK